MAENGKTIKLGTAQLYQFEYFIPQNAKWEALQNGIWQFIIPVADMPRNGLVNGYLEMPPKLPYGFEIMPCVRVIGGFSVRLTFCCDEANSRIVIIAKNSQGGSITNPNSLDFKLRFMISAVE